MSKINRFFELILFKITIFFNKKYIFNIITFAFYIVLTIIFTRPLFNELFTLVQPGDVALNMSMMRWNYTVFESGNFSNYLNAPFFYPYQGSMLFSETMLFVSLVSYPFYKITGSLVGSYNLMFFLSFVFSAFSAFLLAKYYTKNKYVAVLVGIMYGFGAQRIGNLGHLQILSNYFLPILILFFEKFLENPTYKKSLIIGLLLVALGFTSLYLFVFGLIIIGIIFLIRIFIFKYQYTYLNLLKKISLVIPLILVFLGPIYYQYYNFSKQYNVSRSLEENRYYSADITSIFLTTDNNILHANTCAIVSVPKLMFSKTPIPCYEFYFFPGVLVLATLILTLFVVIKKKEYFILGLRRNKNILYPTSIAFTLYILAMGPFVKVLGLYTPIPLPYLFLYYIFIPVQGIRVPGRLSHLFILFIGIAFAFCVLLFLNKFKSISAKALFFAFIFLITIIELLPITPLLTNSNFNYKNDAFTYLRDQKEIKTILVLPNGETIPEKIESNTYAMLSYDTHQKSMVNGYSGFDPDGHKKILDYFDKNFPSKHSLQLLGMMKVDSVVLKNSRMNQINERFDLTPLKIQFKDEEYTVFEIPKLNNYSNPEIKYNTNIISATAKSLNYEINFTNDSDSIWYAGNSTPENLNYQIFIQDKLIASKSIMKPLFILPKSTQAIKDNYTLSAIQTNLNLSDSQNIKIQF